MTIPDIPYVKIGVFGGALAHEKLRWFPKVILGEEACPKTWVDVLIFLPAATGTR